MKNRIISRIVWFCVLAVLLYTVVFIWTDARSNMQVLRTFAWSSLPIILALVMINFLLRELKWDFFRRQAGIEAPRLGSFLIFFSGYSMAISPGRVGELIKPFMYKEYFGQKMRRSIPLVLCERISDLLGMILLAVMTVPLYMRGVARVRGSEPSQMTESLVYGFLGFSVVAMVAGIAVARNKRLVYGIIHTGMRIARLRRTLRHLRRLYFATYPLLTTRNLLITTAMAAVSWFFECIATEMILAGAGAENVTLWELTFVFCMATIIGGFLFFLPGGLGGFEGSAFRLMSMLGIGPNIITPAILIIRFCTLFFAVGLGFLFILLTSIRYRKSLSWDKFEHSGEEDDETQALS